jgi:CO dehydrogenase/acetyl-CoA synthase beta subunit
MPAQLKEELAERLKKKLEAKGLVTLFARIADESNATTIEELSVFLDSVKHPALTMSPLL